MEKEIKDKAYTVYMHINKTNNKKYIGITSNKVEYRWGVDGKRYVDKNQKAIAAAINKYTWDGFEHIIVAENLTEQEAKNMEKELIALYKTNCCRYTNPKYGYNMTDGGEGITGYRHTEEELEKISQASKKHWENDEYRANQMKRFIGENNSFYGKKHTEESKQKMSEALKGREIAKETRIKISNALTGISRTEETRQKMSKAQKKKYENPAMRQKISERVKEYYSDPTKHPNYGKHRSDETKRKIGKANGEVVLQFDANGKFIAEFVSMTEAERQTGIYQSNISRCCRKLNRSAGGYFWIYKKEYNPNDSIFNQIKQIIVYHRGEEVSKLHDVSVVQLNLDGEFINEFKSMAEGKRNTGCLHISECCNGLRKTDKGYKWMFKKDWDKLQSTIQD